MKKLLPAKKLTKQVSSIVNKYDPIRLLEIGCPQDEYQPEVKRILPLLKEKNFEKLSTKVYHVFVKMFTKEVAGPQENYRELFSLVN